MAVKMSRYMRRTNGSGARTPSTPSRGRGRDRDRDRGWYRAQDRAVLRLAHDVGQVSADAAFEGVTMMHLGGLITIAVAVAIPLYEDCLYTQ